jgi:hypothetical protein
LAGQFFNPVLYTGDGANPRSITGVGFQPDFVWGKRRSSTGDHFLMDSVRGTQRSLSSNTTAAEDVSSPNGLVQSFDSDGATFQGSSTNNNLNNSAITYVAWNWKAGNNAGASNSAGSITSTVSVNTTSGFSIVKFFIPSGSSSYTVGHGLGATPSLIIVKGTTVDNWVVYHSSVSTTTSIYVLLNSTGASGSLANIWGTALPTSSVFGVTAGSTVNANQNVIAYCFAPVAGYSAFGSYTGNGSTDGPFTYTGFRPAFVMIKNSTSGAGPSWQVRDSARIGYNSANYILYPNLSNAEYSSAGNFEIDFLSNGFKIRTSTDAGCNGSGDTMIYAAFASAPFKFSLAR